MPNGSSRTQVITTRQKRLAQLMIEHPDWSKAKCKIAAGYSPKTETYQIESTQGFMAVRQQVERAATKSGVTPVKIFNSLKRSLDRNKGKNGSDHDKTANQAAKIAGEFLGMNAPIQIEQSVHSQTEVLVGLLDLVRSD